MANWSEDDIFLAKEFPSTLAPCSAIDCLNPLFPQQDDLAFLILF